MIFLQIYLISCIPALLFFMATAWEDIQYLRGKKSPGHKFGYNWAIPVQSITPLMTATMLIPVLNLYTGWFIVGGIIMTEIKERFKT